MMSIPPRRGVRRAFTLLELLVVIGIIVLLLGMLFPVIKKIQYASYSANTQQEISQLQNAINQYYATFHAYPGPFSNDQIENNIGTTGIPFETYLYPVGGGAPAYGTATGSPMNSGTNGAIGTYNITGTQNLVLGLLGGLRIDPGPSVGTTLGDNAFAPSEVGLGPLTLTNATNSSAYIPQRNPPFLNVSSGGNSSLLMWCWTNPIPNNRSQQAPTQYFSSLTHFTDLAGTMAQDAPIPVFVDRFPDPGPMPILYLRARTGTRGIISDGLYMIDQGTQAAASYQYDIRDVSPYTGTMSTTANIGLPSGQSHYLLPPPSTGYVFGPQTQFQNKNYPSVGQVNPSSAPASSAGVYFWDQSIPPTNTMSNQTVDYTGRPRAVDAFMLISAGPDGVYGTTDDITSFGTVSQ